MDIYEGEAIYKLKCGFDGKRYLSEINMHGENYKVVLVSSVKRDEYNRIVLRNDLYFVEEACTRTFNIYFDRNDFNRIEIRMSENPGTEMLLEAMQNFSFEGAGIESAIITRFIKGGMKTVFTDALKNMLQPVFHGELVNPFFEMPLEIAETMASEDDKTDEPDEEV